MLSEGWKSLDVEPHKGFDLYVKNHEKALTCLSSLVKSNLHFKTISLSAEQTDWRGQSRCMEKLLY